MKPKNGFKRVMACLLAVILMLTSVPLAGLAGIELPDFFKTEAKAGVANYNAAAAVQWAKDHVNDEWSCLYGRCYWEPGTGDCANFVSQCIYMGGIDQTDGWNYSGYNAHYSSGSNGSWIRATELHDYIVSIGGTEIRNPSVAQIEPGDLIFYKGSSNSNGFAHSAIVIDVSGEKATVAAHTSHANNPHKYIDSNFHLGFANNCTYLVKMHGAKCTDKTVRDFDVYTAGTNAVVYSSTSTSSRRLFSFYSGEYAHVYETKTVNGTQWGYTCGYGPIYGFQYGWVKLSTLNYSTHVKTGPVNHVFGEWYVKVKPTCSVKGKEERVCSVCGYVQQRDLNKGGEHLNVVTATCVNSSYCTACGEILSPALGHAFDSWEYDKTPTCVLSGTEKQVCHRCGYTERRNCAALGHDYQAIASLPGCTTTGSTNYKCSRCGDSYVESSDWTGYSAIDTSDEKYKEFINNSSLTRSRTEYSYRTKSTTTKSNTTGTAPSVSGYTLYKTSWSWGSYGSTQGPVYSNPGSSDSRKSWSEQYVSGYGTTKHYYYFRYATSDGTRGNNTQTGSYINYEELDLTYKLTQQSSTTGNDGTPGWMVYYKSSNYNDSSTGNYKTFWYKSEANVTDTSKPIYGTRWYYQDRSKNYTYSYYKWSNWSSWSTTAQTANDSTEVKTRTTYSFKSAALGHNWGTAVVVKPTCHTDGYTRYTCKRCGITMDTGVIPALGDLFGEWYLISEEGTTPRVYRRDCVRNCGCHCGCYETKIEDCVYEVTNTVDPTCTKQGYTEYTCKLHGETYQSDFAVPLGHESDDVWVVTKAPTCTEKGEETAKCVRHDDGKTCDMTYTREIPANGHSMIKTGAKAPTCLIDGNSEYYYCTLCNTYFADANGNTEVEENSWMIPATGHNGKNADGEEVWVTELEAACGVTGRENLYCQNEWCDITETCENCGIEHHCLIDQREIKEIAPDYFVSEHKDSTCVDLGYDIWSCRNCIGTENNHGWTDIINLKPHDWGEPVETYPTCLESGHATITCNFCGLEDTYGTEKATGHSASPLDEAYEASSDKMELVSSVKNVCGSGTIDTYRCKHIDKNTNERCTYTVIVGEVNDHNFGDYVIDKQPTCTEPGSKHRECQNEGCTCKTNPEEIPPIGHNYAESTKTAATCTEPEKILMVCKNDSSHRYEKETGQPLGHDIVSDAKVEPTCVKTGLTEGTHCKRCSVIFEKQEVIPALGHDYGEWVDDGNGKTHTKTCKREICNESVTEHIVKKDHVMKESDRKEATCYAEGYVEYTCSDCGYNYREPLKKTEHTPGEAVKENVVDPTCTEEGSYDEVVYCKVEECKAELSRTHKTTEKLGHDYGEWTSVDGENHKRICKRDESHIETAKHIMKETDRKEATCYAEGYVEYTCSDCGYSYKTVLGLGEHNLSVWNDDNDDTHTSHCQNEGCTYSVTKDHNFDVILEKKDASAREGGYVIYQCSACGHTRREDIPPVEPSEIVPDKKAVEVGGKALITLSASAATNYVKVITKSKTPIDVILVLDQSGSMKCDVSASPDAEPPLVEPDTSKRKVLIKNANNFVDAIIEDSVKTGADHRIALVGFAMAEIENSNYKAYENTGILVTNSGNKFVGYKELESKNNYSDALILASSENKEKLHNAVKAIDARGATATDKGLEIAKNIFASSKDNGSRKRVVLLITDGVPTHFSASNYENITAAASGAITNAREIKNSQNASIYTLAVYDGAKVEEEFTEYEDGYKGSNGRVEPYDINRFMHLVSSNYPRAVSMDCYGNGSRESGYYMTATNQEAFKKCFETVKSTEITDTSLFDLVTLYDTLSPNLTLTLEDERAMRDDLVKNFGMKNEDIIVSRENGTTKLEFHNVKVKKVDGKHVAQVSFKASLNRNTLEKGDYATNTIDAGIKINEITQKNFEIPSVTVDTERCIVEFFINGVSYSIVDYNLGDKIELPATDLATWVTDSVVEKQYTSYESETEADDEYTVTWKTNGTKTSEKYKYGEVINVPEKVDAPQGMEFAFWTPGVSHFMPAHDLTYTAVYKKAHVCSFKESYEGDCKKGLTFVKTCDCGKVEKTVLEPREHVTKAVVSDKTGKFLVHCTVCGKSNNTVLEYKKRHGSPSTYLSLNLTENNIFIQPGENGLIISVYLGSDYNGKTYNVYRLDKTQKVLVGSYKTENGYLTFTAEHFSIYALCELGEDGNVLEEPNYEKALCAINGHDYKAVVTAPTCKSEGFTTYTCSVCKDSYKDDVTPKVSHNYTAVETAATCTAGGFTTYTCSFCGESYKANETPALGHSDSNGDGICDNCGEKLQEGTEGGKCSHICHSTNSFSKLIWAIIRLLCKIFNTNRTCSCGAKHW